MDKAIQENMHRAFLRECEGADTAILMVHGILGSPLQFEEIAQTLYSRGYAVMAVLLPGHGGGPEDFARTNVTAWRRAVAEAAGYLRGKYKHVILIGHSLGGLLSIHEAIERGADGLVLLSVPMRLKAGRGTTRMTLQILFGDRNKDDDVIGYERKVYSIGKGPARHYPLWTPRFMDLLRLMRKTRRLLPEINIPALIVQSHGDKTVAWKSAQILQQGLSHSRAETLMLEKSGHSYIHAEETGELHERICAFIKSMKA